MSRTACALGAERRANRLATGRRPGEPLRPPKPARRPAAAARSRLRPLRSRQPETGSRARAEGGAPDRAARSAAAGGQDAARLHRVASIGDSGRGDADQLLRRRLDDHRAARHSCSRSPGICATRRTRRSISVRTSRPPTGRRDCRGGSTSCTCLYSTRHRHRIRVKTIVAENQPLPSVTSVWPAANWLEREIYDMFGVNFAGHPDRRRILMPEDWQGFPQRKDYPLEGPGRAPHGEPARLAEAAPGEGRS